MDSNVHCSLHLAWLTQRFLPYFSITPKMTRHIEAIGATIGYLHAVNIPETYRKELVSKITAEIVHTSTTIEGNTLTAQQVFDLLNGKKVYGQEIDIKEIVNYNAALTFIETLVQNQLDEITEQLIREVNAILLQGIRDNIAGKYRTKQVIVGDYLPPEHDKVPQLMREFVTWLNNPQPAELSAILYAGIAHYQLVGIHPFEDGNGRTTRILITLLLLRYGYRVTSFFALERYYNRDRRAYYVALASADQYRVDGKPDLTRWLECYVEGRLIKAERARARIDELLARQPHPEQHLLLSSLQLQLLRLIYEQGRPAQLTLKKHFRSAERGRIIRCEDRFNGNSCSGWASGEIPIM
jgi:Fic family protein